MIQKALSAPEWLTSGAVYQINPRTFSEEGTIGAITKELPFLASLGMGAIYLCPVFEEDPSTDPANWSRRQKASETGNPKNPYRMNDYFRIDEEYGSMDDLAECVRECHRLGMRLILDLVYYHIGPNAPILKTHPEFAKQNADGSFICGGWNFPILDFNCRGLREYLYCNMIYYISELDVDGFRCDCGDMVPLDFWVEGSRRITQVKPDAILINEGGQPGSLYAGFNAIYGFSWHGCVYDVLHKKRTAADLRKDWEGRTSDYPKGSIILRDLDNHDTVTDWPERNEITAGHEGMDFIQAMNCAMDGVPMIYCGNELCDTDKLSMFANRFYPGKFEFNRREEMRNTPQAIRRQEIYRTLNGLRKDGGVLSRGRLAWIDHNNPDRIVAFSRTLGDRKVWFVGNFSDTADAVTLSEDLPENGGNNILSFRAVQGDSRCFSFGPYGFAVISN